MHQRRSHSLGRGLGRGAARGRPIMGAADAYHRTLVSGLEISTGKPDGEDLELLNIGTLTGIALKRSTGRKVLVTNQHIMAGSDDGAYRDADGTEEMYQPDLEEDRRIGTRIDPYAWRNVNRIDLATCELDPDSGREIDHALHGSPRHTDRKVVTPSFYPYVGTWLTMIGAKGGEGRVRVAEVGAEQEIGGKFFTPWFC